MPEKMNSPELAEETSEKKLQASLEQIRDARNEAETALLKLGQLANALRDHVRRNPSENGHSHLLFANAHLRFAGSAVQGMKRTAAMDRIIDRAKAELAENKAWEQRQKELEAARKAKKLAVSISQPSESAFEELYGEIPDAD